MHIGQFTGGGDVAHYGARAKPGRGAFLDVPTGPFYGYNRPGAKVSKGVIEDWWRQGMMGGVRAHYDCIKAFSETDFTEDLKAIEVPTLVLHGDDDQIVPCADSAPLAAKLLKKGMLKTYAGLPHGWASFAAQLFQGTSAQIREIRGSTFSRLVQVGIGFRISGGRQLGLFASAG